jgi:RNA polymerase sigma-54 factor
MALSAKLQLKQSQQLVMTPQLQQAIRLLQLSNLELNEFVDSELERNPLLEREEERPDTPIAIDRDPGPERPLEHVEMEGVDRDLQGSTATADLDADYETVYPESGPTDLGPDLGSSSRSGLRQSQGSGDDDTNLESFAASEATLKDHLVAQLTLAITDPRARFIGGYLIDLVDEAGYLRADTADVADRIGAPLEQVEQVLATLQTFDPAGVLARDLKECLELQLKERGRYDPMIAKLLEALPLLAAHNMTALRRHVGADSEDLADMIAEIKQLNPKPGASFGRSDVQAVVPDIIVRMASDGSWLVEINGDTLPRVLVNRVYYARVTRNARSDQDRGFLHDCLQNANWLVKSLDQRARTILRVAEEIVRQQDGFLTHGVQHLRPLNLKTVAEAIGMHESTVSRVTSNKYVSTPRGLFELKYFFTSSIASAGEGEAYSSEAVRHRIKCLIENESPKAILSDDRLVEILCKEGIDIARRTVAKYREALRIPSSVQRRREKQHLVPTPTPRAELGHVR